MYFCVGGGRSYKLRGRTYSSKYGLIYELKLFILFYFLRKHTENDPKCNALGWCCVPLVTESYGAWGKEAMDSFKMLASRLAIISGKPKSVVLSDLYSRLNLHLVRANATAILSMARWFPS